MSRDARCPDCAGGGGAADPATMFLGIAFIEALALIGLVVLILLRLA